MLKERGPGQGTKGATRQAAAIQREKKNEGQKSSKKEAERCPLELATRRSEGKCQGEETRLEWAAERVGGEGMEEIHVNTAPPGIHQLICQKISK